MPSNVRQAIKRKLLYASRELFKASDKMAEVGAVYKDEHPEITDLLSEWVAAIVQLKDAIDKFSAEC